MRIKLKSNNKKSLLTKKVHLILKNKNHSQNSLLPKKFHQLNKRKNMLVQWSLKD